MFDFHEKRRIRSFVYSKFVVFFFLLLSLLLSISVYNRYVVSNEMKTKLDARRTTLGELQQHALMLEAKVKYLENDRGIEEELRNRFNVVKEGEKAIILIDPVHIKQNQEVHTEQGNENTTTPKKSFFNLFNL